ncbi:MAG: allantoinase AllB [Proteobacteria bacterium]|nr:allantoinase AllB [Pseudomonadota bacterium]
MARHVLRSRRVLTPEGLREACVTVEHGRIASITPTAPDAEDLGDRVLMPALVDSHVHMNEPGRTEWEGFQSATAAAALGGVCALADMPLNCLPVTTTASALEAKRVASEDKLAIDVAFWGGVVPGNVTELAPMVEAGAAGFKAFLCHSGIDEFPDSPRAVLREAMHELKRLNSTLLVHAELEHELPEPPSDAAPQAYLAWLHARPRSFEDAATAMVIELMRETGCRVHVVHLSSGSALPLIAAAKADGLPLTVETCPHYLCLTAEEVPDGATQFKCAPPIREAANRDLLWAGLRDGVIDFVVSDHSPCIPGLKLPERGDFLEAWGGIASLQLGLAAVWTEARMRGFGLDHLVRWMSAGPASLLGLHDRGRIAVGARADLVAWEPETAFLVDGAALAHKHPTTPYAGRELTGRVVGTWLAGVPVARDGVMIGAAAGTTLARRVE